MTPTEIKAARLRLGMAPPSQGMKAMKTRTRKIGIGACERTDGKRTVHILWSDLCAGWIAGADWTRDLYTDPLITKRDAVSAADQMLAEAEKAA